MPSDVEIREMSIPPVGLSGTLHIPRDAKSLVVFVHGSGSSRFSPRNRATAAGLNALGFATLLFDLLTAEEEVNRTNVFDIPLLAQRLDGAIHHLKDDPFASDVPLGLFGASTGAAAALVAASQAGNVISAIVSRGGRPDLAGDSLDRVSTPTLLIVGGIDFGVIELNEQSFLRLKGPKALEIIPGASHLFPEPGALEAVIGHAAQWFARHLTANSSASSRLGGGQFQYEGT